MKKRKSAGVRRRRVRMSPQRLVEGDDFRINKAKNGRIEISETGMARIIEEWLKGRTSILVVDGSEVVRMQGKTAK